MQIENFNLTEKVKNLVVTTQIYNITAMLSSKTKISLLVDFHNSGIISQKILKKTNSNLFKIHIICICMNYIFLT